MACVDSVVPSEWLHAACEDAAAWSHLHIDPSKQLAFANIMLDWLLALLSTADDEIASHI